MEETTNKCCGSKNMIIGIIIIIVILFGILSYIYVNNEEKNDLRAMIAELQNQVTNINISSPDNNENIVTTIDETANWQNAILSDLGISFKYPSQWGSYSVNNQSGEAGISKSIIFSENPANSLDKALISYASSGFTAGRSGSIAETLSYRNKISISSCDDFQNMVPIKVGQCEEIKTVLGNAYLGIFINREEGDGMYNDHVVAVLSTHVSNFPIFSIQKNGISSTEINIVKKILSSMELIK